VDLGHLTALWPIAHREEGADVAVARQFEVGLLLLEHPPQGLWSLHLVPQHPRIHPDLSGRALERRAGCGESTLEAFGRRPQCSWHRPWWAVIRNPTHKQPPALQKRLGQGQTYSPDRDRLSIHP